METMYDRVKRMTQEEMKHFVYWVYMNGNKDGEFCLCDSGGSGTYFGGAMLSMDAVEVMPNDIVEDLWDNFFETFGDC